MSGVRRTAAALAPLASSTDGPFPWDLRDLAGLADIAAALLEPVPARPTSRARNRSSTVLNWTTRYPDFPRPLIVLAAAGPLYSLEQVIEWHDARWPRLRQDQQQRVDTGEDVGPVPGQAGSH